MVVYNGLLKFPLTTSQPTAQMQIAYFPVINHAVSDVVYVKSLGGCFGADLERQG